MTKSLNLRLQTVETIVGDIIPLFRFEFEEYANLSRDEVAAIESLVGFFGVICGQASLCGPSPLRRAWPVYQAAKGLALIKKNQH